MKTSNKPKTNPLPPQPAKTKEPVVRVAIYVRVSKQEAAKDGLSLAAQEVRLKLYCDSMRWKVARVYREDGKSATSTSRPKYREMMSQLDEFDRVLVVRIDRIHRNSHNFHEMLETLKKAGKGFVCAADQWDTSTPIGGFIRDLMARFAQWESEQMGQRIKEVIGPKLRDTDQAFGRPSYGYDRDPTTKMNVVNEKMAAAVRLMFELGKKGMTFRAIADELNRVGHRTREGRLFSAGTVAPIMVDPAVTGARWMREHPRLGAYAELVSPEVYLEVMELFRSRSKQEASSTKRFATVEKFREMLSAEKAA